MESVVSTGRDGMKPAWYGGNKIPDSYLKQFQRSDVRGTDNWRGAFEMTKKEVK